jgi:S-adenosylmethionine/arginine decarboxylase-like enzyme
MKIFELNNKDTKNIQQVTKEDYGQEAIFDISDVPDEFFHKKTVREFAEQLCDEIDMKRGPVYLHMWGEEKELHKNLTGEGAIKANGLSCIQFLYTSSITIHALDEIKKVFINVFSCNQFDFDKAKKFVEKNVGGKIVKMHNILRV